MVAVYNEIKDYLPLSSVTHNDIEHNNLLNILHRIKTSNMQRKKSISYRFHGDYLLFGLSGPLKEIVD